MKEIFHQPGTPLSITIAADPRLNSTDYFDDQIWELAIYSGEPQTLAVQTTFGLRASLFRIFPRFTIGNQEITNPSKYAKDPAFQHVYPNFIRITYCPFSLIEVESDYWIPNSKSLAGRFRITNKNSHNVLLKFELVALLSPSDGGDRIIPDEVEGVPVLIGSTNELIPVVFISGGATSVSSPYPALVHTIDLAPGNSQQFTWSQAGLKSKKESFYFAREIASSNWEAEFARIELQNSNYIEVYTGDEEWDRAFLLAQKNAYGLLQSGTEHLRNISYVTTRVPDDGYSLRGDGSDYSPQWSGQTPIDSYYLSNLLLPGAPGIMKKILINHLDSINENEELDWRSGLGGQTSNRLATPLLASIAWKIYQVSNDEDFLRKIFPVLIQFFLSWFSNKHDRDQDGIPEWDHPLQAGIEDHPIFSRWHDWARGLEITTAESPSLCAFLYRESQTLIQIADLLGESRNVEEIKSKSEKLLRAVDEAWDEKITGYSYWDRDSHTISELVILGQFMGSGSIEINNDFSDPQRIVFQIKSAQEITRRTQLIIHGKNAAGKKRIEIIPPERLLWFPGWGTATSEHLYHSIESIEVKGLDSSDSVVITNAGLRFQDITTLLPIWAEMPSVGRAKSLVEKNITNSKTFWEKFGLSACPIDEALSDAEMCNFVYLPWCLFIGEGLLSYGYRDTAAELITNIMNGINHALREDGCFKEYFNAKSAKGYGDNDGIRGLAPLGFFLETLGVQILSNEQIRLSGVNPFPWPVTVKFRGMTVLRGLEKTQVIFPDGQTILVEEPEPCLVSLE